MEINDEGKSLVVRLDNSCEQCGSYTYEIRYKKPHVGLYCKCCGKYVKWLSKEEKKKYGIVDAKLVKYEARQRYEESKEEELPWD